MCLRNQHRRTVKVCCRDAYEPVNWEWNEDNSWKENIKTHLENPDVGLVVGEAIDPNPYPSWIETIDQIRDTRRRSWPFHGTVTEYLSACRPLLLNSPAAYLVDCYLDPLSDVAESLLRSLLALINGSKCYSIEIITRRAAFGLRSTEHVNLF